eukprot:scaffold1409_cov245-Pinguiococcus_pyrenoidosus.AAC.2
MAGSSRNSDSSSSLRSGMGAICPSFWSRHSAWVELYHDAARVRSSLSEREPRQRRPRTRNWRQLPGRLRVGLCGAGQNLDVHLRDTICMYVEAEAALVEKGDDLAWGVWVWPVQILKWAVSLTGFAVENKRDEESTEPDDVPEEKGSGLRRNKSIAQLHKLAPFVSPGLSPAIFLDARRVMKTAVSEFSRPLRSGMSSAGGSTGKACAKLAES